MAQNPASRLTKDVLVELASQLLTTDGAPARAALLASVIVDLFPDSGCALYRFTESEEGSNWTALSQAGEISVVQQILPADTRLLLPFIEGASDPQLYQNADLRREDFSHLHVATSLASIAYLPVVVNESIYGVIEIISLASPLNTSDITAIAPIVELTGPALLSADQFEEQQQDLLDSVHRMTQLYDLEKSLNATLELFEVIQLIPEKTRPMLDCQAMHLWLFEGDALKLMATGGHDSTIEAGATQSAGQGYVGDMAEEGEALLIDDPQDERLTLRNSVLEENDAFRITTALIVPLMQEEAEVGVLEAVNRTDGAPFDDDDQFFLTAMAETVSNALKNSSLMHAERKLAILEALVHVSSEITSTLRLDRLLQIIVNSPQNVLPFERCVIALDNRGRLQLKAISGMASIPMGDAQVDPLLNLMPWLSEQSGPLHLKQHDESSDLPVEIARYFAATGSRGIYSLPLVDDQGRVGLLLYEASDPNFLDLPHTEMIRILAGQATVAIRNALLYREVPLISLLEPMLHGKQALFRTSGKRRLTYLVALSAAVLFLIFCPLPMRISGEAVVAPQHQVTVAAPLDGNVVSVFAHEGQRVAAGEVLGAMSDWQWRSELNSAEARYRAADLVMESNLAHGSAQAGADRAQVEFLRAEVARARNRLESSQLRSPIAGIISTPALQNAAGEHLDAGAAFAQVLDLSSAVVEVAVPQRDVALIQRSQSTAVKLDSYPQRSWHGAVEVVSPQAQPADGDRNFIVRVPIPNDEALLRGGMTGHAKIFVGYRPAGYVLLRKPSLWAWQTLWNWIGW